MLEGEVQEKKSLKKSDDFPANFYFRFATYVLGLSEEFGDFDIFINDHATAFEEKLSKIQGNQLRVSLKKYTNDDFDFINIDNVDYVVTDYFSYGSNLVYAMQVLNSFDHNFCRNAIYMNSRFEWCKISVNIPKITGPETARTLERIQKYQQRDAHLAVPELAALALNHFLQKM